MLRETYRSDPSVLGEAICEDSALHGKAIEEYSKIHHSVTLSEWLEFLIEPRVIDDVSDEGIQQLIALPLEKQRGGNHTFEDRIHQLSLHLDTFQQPNWYPCTS